MRVKILYAFACKRPVLPLGHLGNLVRSEAAAVLLLTDRLLVFANACLDR